jgi:hypothetical protein
MTAERLRATRDAVPFHPFTIRLADGRSFRIHHRDSVSISPGGRTRIVYQAGEAFSILDTLLVTELSVEGPTPSPGRPADTEA